jgi:hypothetical protein
MIKRNELLQEMELRKVIRGLLKTKILKESKQTLNEEKELRKIVRHMILKEVEASSPDSPYDITAMNFLRTLLQVILKKVETGYKSLMTSPEQRKSFRAHILNAVDDSLQTIDASPDSKDTNGDEQPVDEEINIDINDDEPAPEGFIDIEDDTKKKEKEEPEMSPEEQFGQPLSDSGLDKTGRNKAYSVFNEISSQIEDTYNSIDPDSIVPAAKIPEMGKDTPERKVFRAYLLKNLQLYFDKFESELSTTPQEPQSGV